MINPFSDDAFDAFEVSPSNVPLRKKRPTIKKRVFKRDNYTCVYCGKRRDLTLDHVIPKSKGGKKSLDNLVTACVYCNRKKGALALEIFLKERKHT